MWLLQEDTIHGLNCCISYERHHDSSVRADRKQIADVSILVAQCLAIQKVMVSAIQHTLHRIIIESDSQAMVNSIYGIIFMSKEIINIVEDIRSLFLLVKDIRIEYYSRVCNREAYK